MWIWEQPDWPAFTWDEAQLSELLRRVQALRQELRRRCEAHGDALAKAGSLDAIVRNITASYAIEGEAVDSELLRSSLGRRLELHVDDGAYAGPRSEALAELVVQVTSGAEVSGEISIESLQGWHRLLFPEGVRGRPACVGAFRPADQPMHVYGPGRAGRPHTLHFTAPPGDVVEPEVAQLVDWLRDTRDYPELPPPVRAAVAHLWLVSIHPWEDGNGRMSRAVGDRVLADWDPLVARLVPLSVSLLEVRQTYYDLLERTQRGGLDISAWVRFFLEQLCGALERAIADLDRAVLRQRFWFVHADQHLHAKQRKLLKRMLADQDNFPEGVAARQYKGLAKVDKATATRHLTQLVHMGVLRVKPGTAGRNTRYVLTPLTPPRSAPR